MDQSCLYLTVEDHNEATRIFNEINQSDQTDKIIQFMRKICDLNTLIEKSLRNSYKSPVLEEVYNHARDAVMFEKIKNALIGLCYQNGYKIPNDPYSRIIDLESPIFKYIPKKDKNDSL